MVGLIGSVLFLLLSVAALPVFAMSMGGYSYIAIPVLTTIIGIASTTAFTRALRRA
jgi:hypothetical protein